MNTLYQGTQIESLTCYLFSDPKFHEFAWYASKLANEHDIFYNVNQLCFPVNVCTVI